MKSRRVLSVDYRRDGFDLDQLIRAAQNSDAHERARHVMPTESLPNDRPRLDQVALIGRRNENSRAQHVLELGSRRP